ncbi:MAG: hypothetical protein ACHQIM_16490 [Sphingobacteriales bacterium]
MKAIFTSLLVLSLSFIKGQSEIYQSLFSFLSSETIESPNDRLIAVNVWSLDNKESRALNQEFEKVFTAYTGAWLKGGNKGLVAVIYCIDKNNVQINIALKKDGIIKVISTNSENKKLTTVLKDKSPGYNCVFNKDGKIVYENLKEGTVFDSIHNLISR